MGLWGATDSSSSPGNPDADNPSRRPSAAGLAPLCPPAQAGGREWRDAPLRRQDSCVGGNPGCCGRWIAAGLPLARG